MHVEMRDIHTIRPYANNPRRNDHAVAAVAASIREFGFRQPIVVDEAGVIVVGSTRYKAALLLGLQQVSVHVATGLTPAQIKAYRLADNKTAELAQWDDTLLVQEIAELQKLDFDIDLLGFSAEELTDLFQTDIQSGLTDPDAVPAPPDAAVTQPGELWELGCHRLLCGDSSKAEDVDRLLDGAAVHLVNSDPLYNVRVEPRSNNAIAAGLSSFTGVTPHQKFDVERHPDKAKRTTKKLHAKDRPLINDFVSDQEFDRLLRAWFANLSRVLVPGRCFYLWGGYANCANYPPVLRANGLYFSQAIIWVKEHPVLTRKDFMGNHEWCFYGWKEGAAHLFYGPNNATDVRTPRSADLPRRRQLQCGGKTRSTRQTTWLSRCVRFCKGSWTSGVESGPSAPVDGRFLVAGENLSEHLLLRLGGSPNARTGGPKHRDRSPGLGTPGDA